MLFTTFKKSKYNYSGDYYGFTTITSEDGTVTEKRYNDYFTKITFSLSTSFIGDIVILSDSKLQNTGRITNIVDRNGKEVYQNGEWEVKQTQPVVNAMGIVEGYKYKAKIISGDI